LAWLGARFGPRRVVVLGLLAVSVMLPLTWIRNNEWATDVRLFETEYRRSGAHPDTLRLLTGAHFRRGNFSRGAEICDRHTGLIDDHPRYARHCGMLYVALGRTEDAERAYLFASEWGDDPGVNSNLAMLYLELGRRMDAIVQFQLAIEREKHPAAKNLRRGFQLAYLYPTDPESLAKARDYFKEAYRMQPMLKAANAWAKRMERALEELEN
jgi:tetratricopeptide (TPR) repeat protein